ncbi:MAG: type I methionyl aminopeptidase [Acidobacteria bacterium]|nr:type I methionyl aminopeptidase [Acidobacteriota bacterium]
MSIGSTADWDGLREVGRVARLMLESLTAQVRPGVTTGALDDIAAGLLEAHGARSAPAAVYGFPGHVLISVNDEIVHGIPGPRRIRAGDVVKIDVTIEKGGYVADAARSVVVEPGSATAHRLVACARAAFAAALSVARAGVRVNQIGRVVEREVRRRGFTVVEGLAGHGVGRTIHEEPSVPNRYDAAQRDVLTEGLVLTIEPMISTGSPRVVQGTDGWTLRTWDGSLSAHHEHTLVITRGAPIVLTGAPA